MQLEPPIPPLTGEYLAQAMDQIESLAPPRCDAAWPYAGGFDIGSGDAYGVVWQQCDSRATAMHRYACVHEHVRTRVTCDEHAPQPGIVGCRRCFDAGHECEMRAELVEVLA